MQIITTVMEIPQKAKDKYAIWSNDTTHGIYLKEH
jgi:hypothetical protein